MNRDYAEYLQALGFETQPFGAVPTAGPAIPPTQGMALPSSESGVRKAVGRVLFLVAESSAEELQNTHPAGELLGKMIQAMGLKSHEVRIAALDAGSASATLARELETYAPEMIVAMGERAAFGMGQSAIPSILTCAPAALLKNPALKKSTWEDLQKVMAQLGLKR